MLVVWVEVLDVLAVVESPAMGRSTEIEMAQSTETADSPSEAEHEA